MNLDCGVRILGINGSPRKAATEYAVREALASAETVPGVVTEFISLNAKKINPCRHCDRCLRENHYICEVYKEDDMNDLLRVWLSADGYIVGSPVYSMGITPQLTAFFSRLRPLRNLSMAHPEIYTTKVGAAIAVGGTRHGGQEFTAAIILNQFISRGILAVGGGGTYSGGTVWSKDERREGAIEDEVGMATVRTIGKMLAEAARVMKAGRQVLGINPPDVSAIYKGFPQQCSRNKPHQ